MHLPRLQPSRRWLQFSVRGLLVVLTLAAIWLGVQTRRARDQKRAVSAILSLGGTVDFYHEYDSQGRWIDNATPPGPTWLRRWIGDDYFRSVVFVGFDPRFSLSGTALDKRVCKVTDEDLEHLAYLQSIRGLNLDNQPIDGSGLPHIASITSLRSLRLNWTKVDDEGIEHISGLRNLEFLGLAETRITDRGLSHLRGLERLEVLVLSDCAIRGEGLAHLRELKKLRVLHLHDTRINDDALAYLAQVPNLQALAVSGTNITDEGVEKLAGCANLKGISLERTCVTARSITFLRHRLPRCRIQLEDHCELDWANSKFDEDRWALVVQRLSLAERHLKYIDLSSAALTDAMVLDLKDLDGLEVLDLRGASVSEAAVRELQAALPKCEIRY